MNIKPEHIKVQSVVFHRNGVSGASFHTIRFLHPKRPAGGEQPDALIAVVFDTPNHVAVMSQDKFDFDLARFRGDAFEPALRRIVKEWDDKD